MRESRHKLVVMHIIGRLIPGGVERRTLELIRCTRESGIQHHVLVTSGQQGSLDDEYRAAGVNIHYAPLKSVTFPLRFIRLLRREKIVVLHSNVMYASGFVLLLAWIAGLGGRIAHLQSDGQRSNITWRKRVQYMVARWMIDVFATHIVGLTPEGLSIAWSPQWRDDPRCQVIVNGVLVADFATSARTELLAPVETAPVLVHLGRGDLPTKNREKAVTVLSELSSRFSDSVLVFVGRDGGDPAAAEQHRRRLLSLLPTTVSKTRVRFVGEVDNVADYLAASDLFLFTSRLEGLPGVVIEAFASGLPVVASSLPGVRFIADNVDGAIARVLDPDDDDVRWVDAIQDVLEESSRSERGRRAKSLEGGIFDLSVAARSYLSLWRDSAAR